MNQGKPSYEFAGCAFILAAACAVFAAYGLIGVFGRGVGKYLAYVLPALALAPAAGAVWSLRLLKRRGGSTREVCLFVSYWVCVFGVFAALFRWLNCE
jgi:hypothetical protein